MLDIKTSHCDDGTAAGSLTPPEPHLRRTFTSASTWCSRMGLLQKSTSGLGTLRVSGRSRVPYPPTRIKAFMLPAVSNRYQGDHSSSMTRQQEAWTGERRLTVTVFRNRWSNSCDFLWLGIPKGHRTFGHPNPSSGGTTVIFHPSFTYLGFTFNFLSHSITILCAKFMLWPDRGAPEKTYRKLFTC